MRHSHHPLTIPGLRVLLAAAAFLTIYVGIDNALGGITTLGLQGPTNSAAVNDLDAFAVRDNHVRFLGGVWLAAGLVMLAAAIAPAQFRQPLLTVTMLAVGGGLARFSASGIGDLWSNALLVPLIAEFLVLPALGLATWTLTGPRHALGSRPAIA
ncbi:MAG: DUF4345 domain-containing protein [Alphaproteobacteria bacterium]|nr:DUF4345 domain-containing protein [Alphaproteobacteria bacterium]